MWLTGILAVAVVFGLYALSSAQRKFSGPRPAAAEAEPVAPVPLTPAEREAREVRLSTLLEGSLADARNGQDFAETPGYRRLLQIVMSYPADQFASLATRPLDRDAALRDPDAWRGEFVTVRGVIWHRWAERLSSPIFGAPDVYRLVLTDGDGSAAVMVDLLADPPPVALHDDPVDVQGVFYRTVRFEERSGMVEAPYLVARTVTPVHEPRRSATGLLRDHGAAALVGTAIAIALARLLIYVFQRRSRRPGPRPESPAVDFHQMFENRLRDEGRDTGPRSKA